MLPIQPIVSNIYIASRQLAKYVVKLFHRAVRPNTLLKVPTSYYSYKKKEYTEKRETYILIDVTSLFTKVPSEFTNDVILKRICD